MKARRFLVLFVVGVLGCGSGDSDESGDRGIVALTGGTGAAGTLAGFGAAGAAGMATTVGVAGASGAAGGASGMGASGAPAGRGGAAGSVAGGGAAGTIVGAGGAPAAGRGGAGGAAGSAGASGAAGGGGAAGAAGGGGAAGGAAATGETGRLVGMTAAHNAVRARQMNPMPSTPLPPMTWSAALATTAQAYAEKLAADDCAFQHSQAPGLGENLAFYGGIMATAQAVTEGWAAEEECYTFGKFMTADACDMQCAMEKSANGCGHYTQIVWRNTLQLGCGVAACPGAGRMEIWVCNYKNQGNIVGQSVY